MPMPMHLFIDLGDSWTQVYGYGPEPFQPSSTTVPTFHNHVMLETGDTNAMGTGQLFAATNGKLSRLLPGNGNLDPTEEIVLPEPGSKLPDKIDIYLHISPLTVGTPYFRAQSRKMDQIVGFAYLNVETASLQDTLAELLDSAVLPVGSTPRSNLVELFVLGAVDVSVPAGHSVGRASTFGAPSGKRRAGFTVLTSQGPMDPSYTYDLLTTIVSGGQGIVQNFLNIVPKRWPLFDVSMNTGDAINLTRTTLFSMPVLNQLRESRQLSPEEWRQVGDNQKALWRERLLKRTGHAPDDSQSLPFEFDDLDWKNLFQLEAVVEFYANFDDPWKKDQQPIDLSNQGYQKIDFLNPVGAAATANGNVVTLDGTGDLTRVKSGIKNTTKSIIRIRLDSALPGQNYRINKIDITSRTVTLDVEPQLSRPSSWEITLPPILVIVDSFGGRVHGSSAELAGENKIRLDIQPKDLAKVNPNFDTIYLPSDVGRKKRTYRITSIQPNENTISLDGKPDFEGRTSTWDIPAGISGELPPLDYELSKPGGDQGYDHYDGVLFIVHNETVLGRFRWSSYTSRANSEVQHLSSVRGNRQYDFAGYRSPKDEEDRNAFKNYNFQVIDPQASYDGVREARFYFSTPVSADKVDPPNEPNGGGKKAIRLHQGTRKEKSGKPAGTGSAGCLISPAFTSMRDVLIEIYQREFIDVSDKNDAEVNKIYHKNLDASIEVWKDTNNGDAAPAKQLKEKDWNEKIRGTLWLIRPDERPLA